MKGLFIPGITAEMFRKGCLESIEALMAEEAHKKSEAAWKQKEKLEGRLFDDE